MEKQESRSMTDNKGWAKGFNPILPLDEYTPDGESHVFGDRIYLFGSHDTEGGKRYCAQQNYVGWSAPLDNPTDWRYEGVIYDASQDPDYMEGEHNDLYAPDVVQGNDGRYYLYYNLVCSGSSASGNDSTRVAVCDTPTGKYEFHGIVRNPDGSVHKEYLMGDPAVINDNGTIRLYCGWSLSMVAAGAHAQGKGQEDEDRQEYQKMRRQREAEEHGAGAQSAGTATQLPEPGSEAMKYAMMPVYKMPFHRDEEEVENLKYPLMGANTMELADDMLTVVGEVKRIVPGQFDTPKDSIFYGHAFYEASSIRKINGKYYFIYSSENSNELCYATSDYPDRDFVYGGTIISNGDVGYQGRKGEDRTNMTANDHGSLECINGQWYIFHHRQTHKSTFSRQACAERVMILPDGSIAQAECTSMGLREGLLTPEGVFPAPISCVLTNGHMPHCTNTMLEEEIPCITHDGEEHFITDITEGTVIGYKYFDFDGTYTLTVTYRSSGQGMLEISDGERALGQIACASAKDWSKASTSISCQGKTALFFTWHGEGAGELLEFSLGRA